MDVREVGGRAGRSGMKEASVALDKKYKEPQYHRTHKKKIRNWRKLINFSQTKILLNSRYNNRL